MTFLISRNSLFQGLSQYLNLGTTVIPPTRSGGDHFVISGAPGVIIAQSLSLHTGDQLAQYDVMAQSNLNGMNTQWPLLSMKVSTCLRKNSARILPVTSFWTNVSWIIPVWNWHQPAPETLCTVQGCQIRWDHEYLPQVCCSCPLGFHLQQKKGNGCYSLVCFHTAYSAIHLFW